MERLIFHIDVNSAFLSWEAARRVSEGLPDLREICSEQPPGHSDAGVFRSGAGGNGPPQEARTQLPVREHFLLPPGLR